MPVLQQHGVRAVQHAGRAGGERGRIVAETGATTAGFDADDLDAGIAEECMESADGIGSATHAGDDAIRQAAVRSSICARASRR